MTDTGHDALAHQLRGTPPLHLTLDDADRQRLADLVRAARVAQGAELQQSLLAALDHLPRPLRGPVRKVFGL